MADMQPQGEVRPHPDGEISHEANRVRFGEISGLPWHSSPWRESFTWCWPLSCNEFSKEEAKLQTQRPPLFALDVDVPTPHLQGNPAADLARLKTQSLDRLNTMAGSIARRASPIFRSIGRWTSWPDGPAQGGWPPDPVPRRRPSAEEFPARLRNPLTGRVGTEAMKTSIRLSLAILMFGVLEFANGARALAQCDGRHDHEPGGLRSEARRRLPLDLRFRDEAGHDVRLGDYFGRRPVLLVLVYYRCPLLCNQVLNGLTRSLKPLTLTAGSDFEVVAVSIKPGRDARAGEQEKDSVPGAL